MVFVDIFIKFWTLLDTSVIYGIYETSGKTDWTKHVICPLTKFVKLAVNSINYDQILRWYGVNVTAKIVYHNFNINKRNIKIV